MVFFTCNACGEALKKNQVEKHYLHKCRRCEVLTCVDCHKVSKAAGWWRAPLASFNGIAVLAFL